MGNLDCNKLLDYHDSILKLEITSLMALWDKLANRDSPNEVLARTALNNTKLKNFEDDFKKHTVCIVGEKNNLWDDFLKEWRKGKKKVNNIYRYGENYNSGVDKGTPEGKVKVEPEDKKWLSNAYGGFKDWIFYVKEKDADLQNLIINCISDEFRKILADNNLNWETLNSFRQKVYFLTSRLLSDDRFPINDISLWDQSYMAASMFKACLAEAVMKGNLDLDMKNYGWRILGVQYDKLGAAEKGYKPAHIQWYREQTAVLDEKVKELLEYKYPIGNEIYRDETGIYFLVGEGLGEDKADGLGEIKEDLNCLQEKIFKIFTDNVNGEFYPAIFVSRSSRGLMQLGYLLEKARENFLYGEGRKRSRKVDDEKQYKGLCQICRINLVEKNVRWEMDEQNICEYCWKEKGNERLGKWLKNMNGETIWMSELRDKNQRVALATLKFEIKDWLNGNMLNTCLLRKSEYEKYVKGIKSFILLILADYDIESHLNIQYLIQYLENKINDLSDKIEHSKGEERDNFINEKKNLNKEKKLIEEISKIVKEIKQTQDWFKTKKLKEKFTSYENDIEGLCSTISKKYSETNYWKNYLLEDFIFFPLELAPEAYVGCKSRGESFDDFIRQMFFNSIIGNEWEGWIRKSELNNKIDWDNKSIKWDEFRDVNDESLDMLASLLFQFMVRKNPSPARIRRIWENTRSFLRI